MGDEYVSLFAMSRTIADSSGRCYLLSRTIRDEYVFHLSMFNRLSDVYPGRAQKHTPLARLSSTPTPFAGRLVGRMQYAPTLPEKDKVSLGWCFPSSQTIGDKSVFHFSMSNRLSDRYPGRAQKHTPLARLSSTLSPLAGRIGGVCNTLLPCRQKNRISRVDGRLCLGQREINMYFISSCLIGYQIDTHVGAYCIRPLRVYRLPPRPLQGVWWGVCNTPLPCRKKRGFLG